MISGIIGGIIFLAFYLFLKAGFLFSVLLGAAGTMAVWLIKGRKRSVALLIEGVTDGELKSLLLDIQEKTEAAQTFLLQINDPSVKAMVSEILNKIVQIVGKLKKDPRYVKISRRFFNYYLDTLVKILAKYTELENNRDLGSQVSRSIERVTGALTKIHEAFKGHHRRLLEGDLMSLDAEIDLLEKTTNRELNGE